MSTNSPRLAVARNPETGEHYVILHTETGKEYLFTGTEDEARIFQKAFAEGVTLGVQLGGGSSIEAALN